MDLTQVSFSQIRSTFHVNTTATMPLRDESPRLASGLLAALQGGYLLAKTARDVNLMRVALDMAIAQVRAFSVESNSQN